MSLFFSSRKLTKNFNRTETTREKTSLALNISLCVLSSNHGTGYHSNDNNGEREREKSWWCSSGNNNNNKTKNSFSLFRGELLRRLLLPRLLLLLGVEPGVNGQRVAAQGEHARGLVLGGKVRAGLEGVATVFLEVGGGVFFFGGGGKSVEFLVVKKEKKKAPRSHQNSERQFPPLVTRAHCRAFTSLKVEIPKTVQLTERRPTGTPRAARRAQSAPRPRQVSPASRRGVCCCCCCSPCSWSCCWRAAPRAENEKRRGSSAWRSRIFFHEMRR